MTLCAWEAFMSVIRVGISEYKITNAPNKLMTLGLGSCVGIAIYQQDTMIGGLSHILLPDSKSFKDVNKPQKFADLAIPMMISDIIRKSKSEKLVAKIVGGASMFSSNINKIDGIGKRNIDAVISTLDQ